MTGEAARLAFLDWLAHERRAAPLTVEAYGVDLAGFLGFLTGHLGGEPDLEQLRILRLADLRAWLAHEANEGAGNATRARHLSAVRSFYRFLARRHGVDNPALKLITAPQAKKPLPRALAPNQARAVTDDIATMADTAMMQARDTALFTLLYGCGLRIAEALALNVRDAPLPGTEAMLRVVGKGSKERIVPVGSMCQQALDWWLSDLGRGALEPVRWRRRDDSEAVFLNLRGGRLSRQGAFEIVAGRAREAGIARPVSPHALRHSCATHMLAHGADIRVVQELLGHVSIGTTQLYTKVSAEHLRSAYEAAHPRAGKRTARSA
jgi:integrase/recombinase XerC